MIITQNTKVAEMSILIANKRIKHQHTLQLFGKRFPLGTEIHAFLQGYIAEKTSHRHIRGVDIGKQLAGRRQNTFPAVKSV